MVTVIVTVAVYLHFVAYFGFWDRIVLLALFFLVGGGCLSIGQEARIILILETEKIESELT